MGGNAGRTEGGIDERRVEEVICAWTLQVLSGLEGG